MSTFFNKRELYHTYFMRSITLIGVVVYDLAAFTTT